MKCSLLPSCFFGTVGRAKGLVGPVAPALSIAPALALLGEGAGNTRLEWWLVSDVDGLAGVEPVLIDASLEDPSPPPSMPSSVPLSVASPGICTDSFGLVDAMLFTRDGAGMLLMLPDFGGCCMIGAEAGGAPKRD